MEGGIPRCSHDHSLTPTYDIDADEFCKMCGLACKGWIYSCKLHSFNIHKTCAELKREITHPFHSHKLTLLNKPPYSSGNFQCNACGKVSINKSTYHCSDCKFDLDLNCAALRPSKRTTESSSCSSSQEKNHFICKPHPHPHPLILCETQEKIDVYCGGCKLVIENSSIYVCIECKSFLHKSCSELPPLIEHSFHPDHYLTLLPRPPYNSGNFNCNACGGRHDGLTFHCLECDQFDLDINCAFLMPVNTSDHHHQEQRRIGHPHPLILCKSSNQKNKFPFVCYACQLPFKDRNSAMYCCLVCNLLLHKSCAELADEIQHPLHPNHHLKFTKRSITDNKFECRACLREDKGFAYECLDCEFFIDVPCALSTPLTVNSKLHKHPLAFFPVISKGLRCNICQKIKKSPSFRCVECDFNIHLLCVPTLPPTAKDGNHRHSLTFTTTWVRDYEGESQYAEFYCDRCEKERKLRDPTYYCAKCHYVAHVHCVIQEVVRFMESANFGYRNSATWPTSNEEKEWTTATLTIYSALHEHQLTFFRAEASDLCCNICQLQSDSDLFRCVTCNFNIHFLCISTMPPIVKCKSHRHPLTLTTSLIKDYDDEAEFSEFFCDVCEHERKLSNPTYYCAHCYFVAHIQCAIPEIMNEMKDEWSLAHKHGDTTSTHSLQEDTGNDDIDEEIEALCTEIKQERVALNELRRKYVDEQVLKIEKSNISNIYIYIYIYETGGF